MQLLSLSLKGVILRDKDSGEGKFPESFDTYQAVKPGDLIFCLFDVDETPRTVGLSEHGGMITGAYTVMRTNDKALPKFVYYYYYHHDIQKSLKPYYSGLRKVVSKDLFKSIKIPLPPLEEQKSIANFLDVETIKIDVLIAKQLKLIELLSEKKHVLISSAVTKGLVRNAPMKDSGVDWLGSVPAHWSVKQLKWITPVKRGASPRPIDDPKYFDDDGEYAWVRISDVTSSGTYLESTEQMLSDLGASLSVKLEPGKLFLSIAGSVGKPCITKVKSCIHDGFVYFPNYVGNNLWLYYIFETKLPFGGLGKLGTQLNLNTDTIGSIYLPIPPDEEMIEIISYIKTKFGKFDDLISKAKQSIDLLREHRASLISSAVTGKIDVRSF